MELSFEKDNLLEHFKNLRTKGELFMSGKLNRSFDVLTEPSDEIIDVSKITYDNDETWLYESHVHRDNPVKNLHAWLYEQSKDNVCMDDEEFLSLQLRLAQEVSKIEHQKNIDTRTFTRPKKRFTRPTIEHMYGSDTSNDMNSSTEGLKRSTDSGVFLNTEADPKLKPLHFDLTQSTSSYYFDNILANAPEIDSFQNMSPPSLVNSMCSSTFANLMESSFIKNDPVLREIRDTDYTHSILQDCEAPLFQSFTESCSSINSDTPENFLKKVSFNNGTFRKSATKEFDKAKKEVQLDGTFDKNTTYNKENYSDIDAESEKTYTSQNDHLSKISTTYTNLNGTYRRSPKQNSTISDKTYNQTETAKNLSSMKIAVTPQDTLDDIKQQLSDGSVHNLTADLNRLSYCENESSVKNCTYIKSQEDEELNCTVNLTQPRASLVCSTGSADSLDRMSSLSNSSKGSNKMLNMAEVDAIVEMQERSLQQVMSTPNPSSKFANNKLMENECISPIALTYSDSDQSSNEDYKTVRSSPSKTTLDNYPLKSVKSLGYVEPPRQTNLVAKHTFTVRNAPQRNLRGSYTNLNSMGETFTGSQSRLYKPASSNLQTMRHNLKGSYTSLKPISANLPVAPPPIIAPAIANTTFQRPNNQRTNNAAEMPRIPKSEVFAKPRVSSLPRPVGSGIPRPASRIPGPRTSNIRPLSSKPSRYTTDG